MQLRNAIQAQVLTYLNQRKLQHHTTQNQILQLYRTGLTPVRSIQDVVAQNNLAIKRYIHSIETLEQDVVDEPFQGIDQSISMMVNLVAIFRSEAQDAMDLALSYISATNKYLFNGFHEFAKQQRTLCDSFNNYLTFEKLPGYYLTDIIVLMGMLNDIIYHYVEMTDLIELCMAGEATVEEYVTKLTLEAYYKQKATRIGSYNNLLDLHKVNMARITSLKDKVDKLELDPSKIDLSKIPWDNSNVKEMLIKLLSDVADLKSDMEDIKERVGKLEDGSFLTSEWLAKQLIIMVGKVIT